MSKSGPGAGHIRAPALTSRARPPGRYDMSENSRKRYRPIYLLFGVLACATIASANPFSTLRSGAEKVASTTVHVTKKAVEVPVHAVEGVVDNL